MTAPLDAETKRLRGMTPGQIADEAGSIKAQIADRNERLDALKAEAVRQKITEANGDLFRITLSPPGEQLRLDTAMIRAAFNPEFIDTHLSKSTETGWVLRVAARIDAAARRIAA